MLDFIKILNLSELAYILNKLSDFEKNKLFEN